MIKGTLKKHFFFLITVSIVVLAFVLRMYQLGGNPPSLDWDEASLGWNAYSFLKTGSDEYGSPHPISIRSFNDYKPALYTYGSIPFIFLFGLNEVSVRLLSVVAGTLSVLLIIPLVFLLTKNRKIALLSGLVLSLTPWHIQFSRAAFESNLALFLIICATTCFLWFLKRGSLPLIILSSVLFSLSLYAYHSARLFTPLFVLGLAFINRQFLIKKWKLIVLSLILAIFILLPLGKSIITGGGAQARFSSVTIFNSSQQNDAFNKLDQNKSDDRESGDTLGKITHQPVLIYANIFLRNYLDHFNFDFLFLTGDKNNRHHAPGVGVLFLVQFPLIVLGLYFMAKNKPSWTKTIILWLFVGPMAAAVATDTPHAVRALVMMPPWVIISAYGLTKFGKRTALLLSLFLFVNLLYFFDHYFIQMPTEYAKDWQYGYKEVVKEVLAKEKKYDQIFITGYYDQPYIYFLFYGRVSPVVKNNTFFYKSFDKYVFSDYCQLDTKEKKKKLDMVILAPNSTVCPEVNIKKTIYFPNGEKAFLIGETK